MTKNNKIIVWTVVGLVVLAAATGVAEEPPASTLMGIGLFVSWVVGVARLFRGKNVGLGALSCVVPFLYIAGYLVTPRPGSSLYLTQTVEQQREADLRWPVEAATYRQAVDYLMTEEERRQMVIEAQARIEIDRDVPPLEGRT